MYDEDLHGSLDTPAIRAEVHEQRQYFGPPRSPEEQLAHDQALQGARDLASQVRYLPRYYLTTLPFLCDTSSRPCTEAECC